MPRTTRLTARGKFVTVFDQQRDLNALVRQISSHAGGAVADIMVQRLTGDDNLLFRNAVIRPDRNGDTRIHGRANMLPIHLLKSPEELHRLQFKAVYLQDGTRVPNSFYNNIAFHRWDIVVAWQRTSRHTHPIRFVRDDPTPYIINLFNKHFGNKVYATLSQAEYAASGLFGREHLRRQQLRVPKGQPGAGQFRSGFQTPRIQGGRLRPEHVGREYSRIYLRPPGDSRFRRARDTDLARIPDLTPGLDKNFRGIEIRDRRTFSAREIQERNDARGVFRRRRRRSR